MQHGEHVLTGFLTIGKPYAAACRAPFHLSAKHFGAVKKNSFRLPLETDLSSLHTWGDERFGTCGRDSSEALCTTALPAILER